MTGERHSSSFPLTLLGCTVVGMVAWQPRTSTGWFAGVDTAPWGSAWQVALVLTFAGTVSWYAVRGRPVPGRRLAAVAAPGGPRGVPGRPHRRPFRARGAGSTPGLLVPGAVVLAGAIAVLVAARRPTTGPA